MRMKALLHEKMVLAAIILSCGLVAHSDPGPREGKSASFGHPAPHKARHVTGEPALKRPGVFGKLLSQYWSFP